MRIRNLQGNGFNAMKIEVTYDKGGYSYFTYETKKRGYYLTIRPINVSDYDGGTVEEYMAFSGVRDFILEVKRCSNKSEKLAKEMVLEKWSEYQDYILRKYGVDIPKDLIENEL